MPPTPPIPTEIWEAVLDALCESDPPNFAHSAPLARPSFYHQFRLRQRTLRACALTCQTWRKRAEFLLWQHAVLANDDSFAAFVATVLSDTSSRFSTSLSLVHLLYTELPLGIHDLFITPFPNLRLFTARSMQFSAYPPIFHRMRTPFFAALTELSLDRCTFDSVCDFFDLVWSCPELSRLLVQDCDVQTGPVDVPAIRRMHAFAREHKAEIFTKLTDLRLYVSGVDIA